jgi:hypothetical protein
MRRRIGDEAERKAPGSQARDSVGGPGEGLPLDVEHAVEVEQDGPDRRELGGRFSGQGAVGETRVRNIVR